MIDKRYLVSVDLSSQNQGVTVSSASVSETQIAATTFLTGPKGANGANGTNGTNGVGVPIGGTSGQVLSKINATDYNTQWINPATGTAWGAITGTLSDQTDLQTALGNKVDKTATVAIAYGTDATGAQTNLTYSQGATTNTLARRASGGVLSVGTPTTGAHAATKDYVDNALALDVAGPATSTDNAITRFDGTTGKIVQDSTVIIDDSGNITLPDGATNGNINTGTVNGTMIGTTTTQKIGFLGATPVVRQNNTTEIGLVLSAFGFRGNSTTYAISTSGAVNLAGSHRLSSLTVTGATTVVAGTTVPTIFADATTAPFAVALPAITTIGYRYLIKKIDATANTVTVTPTSGTIDGASSIVLSTAGEFIEVESTTTSGVWRLRGWSPVVTAGTNVTVTGAGSKVSPYVINATGGGGTSGITRSVVNTSGNYSMGSTALTDYTYLVTGAHTGTLPTASGNSNTYTIKNKHTATVQVTRAGSDTIYGDVAGLTTIDLQPGESIDLISNGTAEWSIT